MTRDDEHPGMATLKEIEAWERRNQVGAMTQDERDDRLILAAVELVRRRRMEQVADGMDSDARTDSAWTAAAVCHSMRSLQFERGRETSEPEDSWPLKKPMPQMSSSFDELISAAAFLIAEAERIMRECERDDGEVDWLYIPVDTRDPIT